MRTGTSFELGTISSADIDLSQFTFLREPAQARRVKFRLSACHRADVTVALVNVRVERRADIEQSMLEVRLTRLGCCLHLTQGAFRHSRANVN